MLGAARRYPAFNSLTLPLKAFLITSSGTFGGIITADHFSRKFESAQKPADQALASIEQHRRQEHVSGMTWTERAMDWGRRERYKIVGASWFISMVAAFALVGRNPYLTRPQQLVQARVYAQGLTLAVLIATASFELQDSNKGRGRYETVEYIDDQNHRHTKQVEREAPSDGDPLWKEMVKEEEQRLKERDAAIQEMEKRDRRKKQGQSQRHKSGSGDKPKHDPTSKGAEAGAKTSQNDEQSPQNKDQKKEKKDDKEEKKDEDGDGGEEDEEEEEDDEYHPVPGKKGEGKMMETATDSPQPNKAGVP